MGALHPDRQGSRLRTHGLGQTKVVAESETHRRRYQPCMLCMASQKNCAETDESAGCDEGSQTRPIPIRLLPTRPNRATVPNAFRKERMMIERGSATAQLRCLTRSSVTRCQYTEEFRVCQVGRNARGPDCYDFWRAWMSLRSIASGPERPACTPSSWEEGLCGRGSQKRDAHRRSCRPHARP